MPRFLRLFWVRFLLFGVALPTLALGLGVAWLYRASGIEAERAVGEAVQARSRIHVRRVVSRMERWSRDLEGLAVAPALVAALVERPGESADAWRERLAGTLEALRLGASHELQVLRYVGVQAGRLALAEAADGGLPTQATRIELRELWDAGYVRDTFRRREPEPLVSPPLDRVGAGPASRVAMRFQNEEGVILGALVGEYELAGLVTALTRDAGGPVSTLILGPDGRPLAGGAPPPPLPEEALGALHRVSLDASSGIASWRDEPWLGRAHRLDRAHGSVSVVVVGRPDPVDLVSNLAPGWLAAGAAAYGCLLALWIALAWRRSPGRRPLGPTVEARSFPPRHLLASVREVLERERGTPAPIRCHHRVPLALHGDPDWIGALLVHLGRSAGPESGALLSVAWNEPLSGPGSLEVEARLAGDERARLDTSPVRGLLARLGAELVWECDPEPKRDPDAAPDETLAVAPSASASLRVRLVLPLDSAAA